MSEEQIKDVLYFFSFSDTYLNTVILGTLFLGISAGIIGVFTVLSHRALIVDAISHSILPGVCIGFILSGTKNPIYLVVGGSVSGFISVLAVNFITHKSKIKTDSAIAIVLSTFFSLGVLLLNFIQNSHNHHQTGLSDFLFGKASALVTKDVYMFLIILIFIITIIFIGYRSLKVYLFDKIFTKTIGLSTYLLQSILTFCIILISAIGIQTVGVVLMSALLVSPATSALLLQKSLYKVLILASVFSAISALIGVMISYVFPWISTGPSIIIVMSLNTFLSVLFSSKSIFKTKKMFGIQSSKI